MMALLCLFSAVLAAPLTAEDAVARALSRSVAVSAADAEIAVAEGQARASAGLAGEPVVQGRWAAVGELAGVSVTVPVSPLGEARAEHRAARIATASAQASARRARLEVAAETRRAWVVAVEARQRVVLAEQAHALASRLREGAEAREASGDGSLLDARLARLQQTEALALWMTAVAEEGDAVAVLAAWAGVAVADLDLPDDPLSGMPAVAPQGAARPDVEAARLSVEAARARLSRERAATQPPLRVGAFAEQEGAEFRAGPAVTWTVPVWRRNADGRAEATAAVAVAQTAAAERERVADAELATSAAVLTRLEGAGAAADPRAEARAALDSVAVGYDRGELDLRTASLLRQQILDGQRAWLRGRRVLVEARVRAALAHGDPALLPTE